MDREAVSAHDHPMEASRQRPTFEDLYRAHVEEARRVAYLSVGDPVQAEDIVQESFVRVLGRFRDIRKPWAFRTYLLRTVVSLSKNHFRRKAIERRPLPPDRTVQDPVEPDADLLRALSRLPHRQRAAVVLRYCEDLSEHDTAEILHTSTKAVQSLTRRGLAALRKEVQR